MGVVHAPGAMVLLTRLAKVVYRRSGEELLGMRLRQFVALSFLSEHDGVSQHALAETLCIDANNVVLLLNELEAAGHVERRRDPDDRRRSRPTSAPRCATCSRGRWPAPAPDSRPAISSRPRGPVA
jgi:MarR family